MDYIFGLLHDKELELDYIARDMLLCELLIEKNIITQEEINDKFKKLDEKIGEIKQILKEKNNKKEEGEE